MSGEAHYSLSVPPGLISNGSVKKSGNTGESSELVPIVLGGKGNRSPHLWEQWRRGAFRCSNEGPYRAQNGKLQCLYAETGVWSNTVDADFTGDGLELHAPKDWIPTPETIPEGCYIKTPEGVERYCGTCVQCPTRSRGCKPKGLLNGCGCNTDSRPKFWKWCPKPESEPKKPKFKVGDWVWVVYAGAYDRGLAVQLTAVGEDYADYGGDSRELDAFSPIEVGDEIRVVEKPRSCGTANRAGFVVGCRDNILTFQDSANSHSRWHAFYEDIRLVKKKGT